MYVMVFVCETGKWKYFSFLKLVNWEILLITSHKNILTNKTKSLMRTDDTFIFYTEIAYIIKYPQISVW